MLYLKGSSILTGDILLLLVTFPMMRSFGLMKTVSSNCGTKDVFIFPFPYFKRVSHKNYSQLQRTNKKALHGV